MLGTALLISARWVLPVMGLAGAEDELVQPLIWLTPYLLTASCGGGVLLFWSLKRQPAAPAYPEARRLVEEAEDWPDDFLIGEECETVAEAKPSAAQATVEAAAEEAVAEPEFSFPGLRAVPALTRTVANSAALSAPSLTMSADEERPPQHPKDLAMNIYEQTLSTSEAFPLSQPFSDGLPETPAAPVQQLPPPLPEFAGRAFELAELLAARGNHEIKILGLQGLGGVGKTTLALKLAHQIASHYPDAQIFVDLKGASSQPLSIAEAQSHVIRAFLPAARLPENEAELGQMYNAVLYGKRALLLLDNAVNAQQLSPLLPPETCLLIVTSRQHISLPQMFTSRLEALPPSEAREMLHRLLPNIGYGAEAVAELCGHLPLALRLAASALTLHPDMGVGNYIEHLHRIQQEGTRRPVETVLRLSYELLVPGLRKLWRTLATFPDSFDIPAAAAIWQINPARAENALQRLMAYSLVERNRATGRFRLHDLMMRFAETCLHEDERAVASYRHATHFQSVLHEADALYEQGGVFLKQGLELVDREWHNLQAAQVWAASHLETDRMACELCNSFPDAGRFVLDLRQHPRERIRWSETALAAAQQLKRRKAAARHMITLGDSYADLSEIQHAIDCYQQALEITRASNDPRGQAAALIGLGTAHYLGGGLNRAREFQEAALQLAQELGDHRLAGNAQGSLGLTYYSLGNARKASDLLERQLVTARELGDRRSESNALGGLGLSHYALGNAQRAIELFDKQLHITREIGDRRGEASALSNMGSAFASLTQYRQARTCHEQALAIARETGDRRTEANALGGLGLALYHEGNLSRAIELFERQLAIESEIGDRRGEALALINLGEAYTASCEAQRAIDLLRRAFNLTSQTGDIAGQAHAIFNLSLALDQIGERKQAIAQAEAALELFQTAEHPHLKVVREKLTDWKMS